MAATLLSLRNVVVRYGSTTALQIDSLEIHSGELLAVLGPNGAGKSTLLRVMGLLQPIDEGSVEFCGDIIGRQTTLKLRRRIAMVFPEPLLLNETLYKNTALGLSLRGIRREEIVRRLKPWLDRLGIAHLASREARTLSSGEARRASLARALVLEPELLLLDEPFAALDPSGRESLLRDFQGIVRDGGMTSVFVTHDRNEAFTIADRIAVLIDGKLVQLGSRDEVFRRPATESVAALIGIDNRLRGHVEKPDGKPARFRIGTFSLPVLDALPCNRDAVLCIRAEDMSLSTQHQGALESDCLYGTITALLPGRPFSRCYVSCEGYEIVVALTPPTDSSGWLKAGMRVNLRFDPATTHVIPT